LTASEAKACINAGCASVAPNRDRSPERLGRVDARYLATRAKQLDAKSAHARWVDPPLSMTVGPNMNTG
jgi:hypothetical protein